MHLSSNLTLRPMSFAWLKNYPSGMPHEIGAVKHFSMIEYFDHYSLIHKDAIAVDNMGVTMTFADVHREATYFAAYLQHIGLRKGDHIAIQLPNVLQFPIAYFGAIKAGLVVVPTNPLYTAREMEFQFCDAQVKAVVILSMAAKNLESILPRTGIKHVIVSRMGDRLGAIKGTLINFIIKYGKKLESAYSIAGAVNFNDAVKIGSSSPYEKPVVHVNDLVVLQYTGGTTGMPKGAMLSHHNLLAQAEQIGGWLLPAMKGNGKDIVITALPLYHVYSLMINLLVGYSSGSKNVLITNPRDVPRFVRELKKHKFTVISGVNSLYNALLNHPDFASVDFSELRLAGAGAMALQDVVAKRWKEVTGNTIVQGYGLSETSGALSANPIGGDIKNDTVGLPLPSTELGIFDEAGRQLAQGQTGEICARGPQVMSGYWNDDNDGVFFAGNWFRTGDVGVMDRDGYFRIVDRKKDMIIVSGLKVFPNEVENVMALHPKVLEVGVVGVPDAQCGEAVKVFIVKRDRSLTKEEVIAHCRENMTPYKIPKHVAFVTALPKTAVGKILRRELREAEVV
jgi:long-chain acyl-CoA synthetase